MEALKLEKEYVVSEVRGMWILSHIEYYTTKNQPRGSRTSFYKEVYKITNGKFAGYYLSEEDKKVYVCEHPEDNFENDKRVLLPQYSSISSIDGKVDVEEVDDNISKVLKDKGQPGEE